MRCTTLAHCPKVTSSNVTLASYIPSTTVRMEPHVSIASDAAMAVSGHSDDPAILHRCRLTHHAGLPAPTWCMAHQYAGSKPG